MMMMNTEDCLTFHFLFSQCEPLNSSEIRVTLLLEGGKVETMMARQTSDGHFDILIYYISAQTQVDRVQIYKSQYHSIASTIQVHINRQQGRLN